MSKIYEKNMLQAVNKLTKYHNSSRKIKPYNVFTLSEKHIVHPSLLLREYKKANKHLFEETISDEVIQDVIDSGYSNLEKIAKKHSVDSTELELEYKKRKGSIFKDKSKKQRRDDPDVTYDLKYTKNMLTRVIAQLSGHDASIFTKSVKRLKKIDSAMSALKKEKETVTEDIKEKIEQIHNAEDEVLTRVVETASVTANIAKKAEPKTQSTTDYEKAFMKLYELYPELEEELNNLVGMYTTTRTITSNPRLTKNLKEDSSLSSWEKFKAIMGKFYSKIVAWGKSYDKKLKNIEKEFLPVNESILKEEPVVSSWIDDLEYDEDTGETRMRTLRGYEYDIPMDIETFEEWLAANSKGKFWWSDVKEI